MAFNMQMFPGIWSGKRRKKGKEILEQALKG